MNKKQFTVQEVLDLVNEVIIESYLHGRADGVEYFKELTNRPFISIEDYNLDLINSRFNGVKRLNYNTRMQFLKKLIFGKFMPHLQDHIEEQALLTDITLSKDA